jgi:hypothetical protein
MDLPLHELQAQLTSLKSSFDELTQENVTL